MDRTPNEIVAYIFYLLGRGSFLELSRLRRTCKRFRGIIDTTEFLYPRISMYVVNMRSNLANSRLFEWSEKTSEYTEDFYIHTTGEITPSQLILFYTARSGTRPTDFTRDSRSIHTIESGFASCFSGREYTLEGFVHRVDMFFKRSYSNWDRFELVIPKGFSYRPKGTKRAKIGCVSGRDIIDLTRD